VLDVCQGAVIGKAGRLASQVQVLARPEACDAVAAACFSETATIGLRWTIQNRKVLERREVVVDGGDGAIRAKIVARPGGELTAKAEMADLARIGDRAKRVHRRGEVERRALETRDDDDA
jgi:hypothetical protein